MSIQSVILLLFAFSFNFTPSYNYSMTVEVTDLEVLEGDVIFALYNRSDYFPKSGDYIYKRAIVNVAGEKVSYTFKNLPEGEYAVAVHHDKNANGEFDYNFVGYPLKGYGFSKNFKPRFSAPVFKDVSFNLKHDKLIAIKMLN